MREAMLRSARTERERAQLQTIAALGKTVVQEKAALLALGERVGRDELQKSIRTEFLPAVEKHQQASAAVTTRVLSAQHVFPGCLQKLTPLA